ncbi:MAG: Eco57I restriction-modification methylase domain-containing protein [Candidatus Delongbacteria bacterium]|nr:Eco57I restriction-modification methylase domain-containing protein [Candidatus Delongbacteria bacterium]
MKINAIKPRKALNKAFLKVKPHREEIENFKVNLIQLLDRTNDIESEEFHKNLVIDFLKKTYYDPKNFVNTKGRNDLVIHNGEHAKSTVGVIIEAKKPTNKTEMLCRSNINVKAFQELALYYLRERITHKNLEIKYLIATNIYEWFIFDSTLFDKLFAQNKAFVKQFIDFENGRLAGKNTDFFYKEIAETYLSTLKHDIEFTHFDIRDYEKPLRNTDKKDDVKLVALFKLLSPEHLLKLPFANDSNSLDKRFYGELLHIIGLAESKEGSKKLIGRNPEGKRNTGSLLENAIIQLDSLDKISRLENPRQYGANQQERLFNVALELSITWINRILFLKLLEAQLLSYHKGDKSFEFLSCERIKNYDDLNSLFFQVLAKKESERNVDVKDLFAQVPYLNSSLFEPQEIEHNTLFISNLRDEKSIPLYASTVLKNENGKKKSGNINAIEYLFSFLNAYDFSSEGSEDIQEDNKTLINASVLGLIFEKINGYKDGSFFTPGFITMYMSRETIRRAVVQKFNDAKGWDCKAYNELYDKIEDRQEANKIINSLKIVDPAVGSGHFLVSALNEIIAIKSDLKILQDREGKRLKEYAVEVVNDDLIITDEDGELFEYHPKLKESQRIQEMLFHEKQEIIENCLFGVDININSVKICRLRLWIELLKNSYYKDNNELETLPNIDINIKCGNSLISRFDLDADLGQALKKSKWSIEFYQLTVDAYRNAQNKEQKHQMENLVADIKGDFRSEIASNDKKVIKLNKLNGELFNLTNQTQLFERSKKEIADWNQQIKKITDEIQKLDKEIEEIKSNKIYENAFEWRFEFPEVLNDQGDFIGFDAVIGNPPYMRVQEIQATQPLQKVYYETNYSNAKASYDLANIFFELAVDISSTNSNNAFIFPHKFFNAASSAVFRSYLKTGQYIDEIAHFGANMIFDDADTYTCVAQFSKTASEGFYFQRFPFKSDFKDLMIEKSKYSFITYEMIERSSALYGSNQWILFDNEIGFNVFEKIYTNSKLFVNAFEGIFVGLQTSRDDLYVLECLNKDNFKLKVPISGKEYTLEKELFKPFLMGKDVQRYSYLSTNKYVFFPYRIENGSAEIVSVDEIKEKFPQTYSYVQEHEKIFKARESGKAGKMLHWHTYIYPKNLNKFEQPKLSSMEICANHPNVTLNHEKLYHTTKAYSWVKKENTRESYEYLLAIANSQLLWWFLKTTGDTLQGDARTFKTNYLNPFPLPENVDPIIENKISEKVKIVMEHKKSNPAADTSALESEIDQMVYQLYGLTEEEIAIVEDSVK